MSNPFEGEEWKFGDESNWNTPNKIATDEYSSIIQSFYRSVLGPVVQRGQRMDRDALEMVASELDWKVQGDEFKKLPFKIQNAYQSLLNLANTLKDTDDAVIEEHRDILNGHFLLGIDCHVYGDSMSGIHKGRNPCRHNQVQMYSTLAKARRNSESRGLSLPILESSGQMFDVCKKCPYK